MKGPRSSSARTGFSCKTSRRGEERLRSAFLKGLGFFSSRRAAVLSCCDGVAAGFDVGVGAAVGEGDVSGGGAVSRGGAKSCADNACLPSQIQVAAKKQVRKLFIRSAGGVFCAKRSAQPRGFNTFCGAKRRFLNTKRTSAAKPGNVRDKCHWTDGRRRTTRAYFHAPESTSARSLAVVRRAFQARLAVPLSS